MSKSQKKKLRVKEMKLVEKKRKKTKQDNKLSEKQKKKKKKKQKQQQQHESSSQAGTQSQTESTPVSNPTPGGGFFDTSALSSSDRHTISTLNSGSGSDSFVGNDMSKSQKKKLRVKEMKLVERLEQRQREIKKISNTLKQQNVALSVSKSDGGFFDASFPTASSAWSVSGMISNRDKLSKKEKIAIYKIKLKEISKQKKLLLKKGKKMKSRLQSTPSSSSDTGGGLFGVSTEVDTSSSFISGKTGKSGTGKTGKSGTGKTGKSGTGKTGKSGTGKTGKSGTGKTGKSGTGKTGKSGTGKSGTGKTGKSGTGKSGTGKTGKSGTGKTGKSGKTRKSQLRTRSNSLSSQVS
jgi:hypothetical protein